MNAYIVTLPLWGNFGGMLQAYALLQTVGKVGISTQVLQITEKSPKTSRRSKLSAAYITLRKAIGRILLNIKPLPIEPLFVREILDRLACKFRCKFIPHLYIDENQDLPTSAPYIVGSDQVWRKAYTGKHLARFFMDTIP